MAYMIHSISTRRTYNTFDSDHSVCTQKHHQLLIHLQTDHAGGEKCYLHRACMARTYTSDDYDNNDVTVVTFICCACV